MRAAGRRVRDLLWRMVLLAPLALVFLLPAAVLRADPPASYETTKKLPALHHAVDVVYPEDWEPPRHLKLGPGRKLHCPTCHGLKDIDKKPYDQIDVKVPDFLRGGPYKKLETFCYECHDKDEFERPNIHVMLDEQGKLKEDHCTYCHEEVHKDRKQPLARADYKLRLPPDRLCFGCHLKTPHFNALEHQSVKPKKKMRDHMKESTARHGIVLPLADSGQIMCATCHSPHQYGVIDPAANPAGKQVRAEDTKEGITYRDHPWDAVVRADKEQRLADFNRQAGTRFALGYRRVDREALLRLPARDGTLCLACHEFER